ncbi:AraC family transcriptional regulator [Clostridium sp. SYSU_GA19001]|uniref:AraC family transcriptional regulator n=1 Tax=Clostridium caldaquaticum TaxID=2940653 RepID=UPI0020771E6C|nr:AraC family transcriptional regulator [Clostridium caldaquaticum]MCM8710037.1 AraC family transcriptional regulator [Clostridium caldaquaticum]
MNMELIRRLEPITEEEKLILSGAKTINKDIYTTSKEFTVDSAKMLENGKLIDIRTHTRFLPFPPHKHNYIEIIYMCSGQTTHIINGSTKIVLKQGDLLFFNQHSYHEIEAANKEDIGINFIILPEFFDEVLPMVNKGNILSNFIVDTLRKNNSQASYLHFKVADILPIQNLVENLIWALLNKQYNDKHINQTTMGLLFMHLVGRTDRIERTDPEQQINAVIMKVLRYIEENYKEAALTELANVMNLSISNLSKIIKNSTGYTFKELLQNKRFQKAVHLLSTTTLPVTDIIYRVGYDNTSYFHRMFREKYHMSPKEYRSRNHA